MERMLMTRRDPFVELDALVRRALPTPPRATVGFTPAAETRRDGDDAIVRLELPGMDPATDVTVEVDGGRLVVSGERRDEHTDDHGGRTLREMRYGSFRRTFALPEHITADAVSASSEEGILTVRVSGAYAGTQPRRIAVTSAAPAVEHSEVAGDEPAAGPAPEPQED
ncbi:MAG TPA: Hsp20/alpha crystallin family protein [Segeticoccus sp.]|nr:Hsp20/alpha crystallin family protein [Segeticoccus sp.]